MTTAASEQPRFTGAATMVAHWPLALGLLAIVVPAIVGLGKEVWSTEAGAYGPIVLATGLWLVWREASDFTKERSPGAVWLTAVMLVFSLAVFVFGRAYDYISLQVAGVYGAVIAILHAYFGLRPLFRNWFPLLYLAFVIPPPGWLMDSVTAPLKEFVSYAATQPLELMGVPIERAGVTLRVAQYELLVEDACSGMNSLTGLTAISLFYIYLLRRASWRYALLLVALVIPIAIIANVIRIMTLVLLTYFFGDAVAQGFLHMAAGMFLFATALALIFGIDSALSALIVRRRAAA